MELNLLKEKLRGLIGEAQVEQALDLLIDWLDARGLHEEHDDILLLKSNFRKARYQCEVQGTLPRSEFELIQNRTVSAMQAVARRLEDKPEKIRPAERSRRKKSGLWAVVGVFAILGAVGLGYWVSGKPSRENQNTGVNQPGTTITPPISEDTTGTKAPPVIDNKPSVAPPEGQEEAKFRKEKQLADEAFDQTDLEKACRHYANANKLKKDSYVRGRLTVCDSIKQHGRGTYILRAVKQGQTIPWSSMVFIDQNYGQGENITTVNNYSRGFRAKENLSVGAKIKWTDNDDENNVELNE